jgi:ribosome-binding protein aMBF1 (putative translation factor)
MRTVIISCDVCTKEITIGHGKSVGLNGTLFEVCNDCLDKPESKTLRDLLNAHSFTKNSPTQIPPLEVLEKEGPVDLRALLEKGGIAT